MISLKSTVMASPNQISADLSGEIAILNLQNGVYYGLDPIGAFIWKHIEKPIAVAEVCQQVLAEYDVEPERCQQDVLALLNELLSQGLVEVVNGQTR